MINEDYVEMFRYHAPEQTQIPLYGIIRDKAAALAAAFVAALPPSQELDLALMLVSDANMAANRAVALAPFPKLLEATPAMGSMAPGHHGSNTDPIGSRFLHGGRFVKRPENTRQAAAFDDLRPSWAALEDLLAAITASAPDSPWRDCAVFRAQEAFQYTLSVYRHLAPHTDLQHEGAKE